MPSLFPEPHEEDYSLPYFLKSDERYVELMYQVHSLLENWPNLSLRDITRLKDAYEQVKGNSHHGFEPTYDSHPKDAQDSQRRGYCWWCGKNESNHP